MPIPPLSSYLLLAAGATALGAVLLAGWRLLTHRRHNEAFGLSDALSSGAVGGLIALSAGTALCALHDGTAHSARALATLLGRFLVLAGPALIVGAALGAGTAAVLTRVVARRSGPHKPAA